jgi:uncharacterized membrane protein
MARLESSPPNPHGQASSSRPPSAPLHLASAPAVTVGEQPSVLDWLKSVLRGHPLPIPDEGEAAAPPPVPPPSPPRQPSARRVDFHASQLRLPVGLLLVLVAQAGLDRFEPRSETPTAWIFILLAGVGVLVWAIRAGDLAFPEAASDGPPRADARVRGSYLIAGAILSLGAFLLASKNTFRVSTVVTWVASVVLVAMAFWDGDVSLRSGWERLRSWASHPRIDLRLDGWAVAFWLALGVAAFFRFYHIEQLPRDMWSDQAEKLLDVLDILNGRTSIFFLRNTGREPLQFYMAAATSQFFGTGLTYMTLKIGTTLAGWLTLPFVYLFAREFAGRRVALLSMVLAGVAFWPNVISRTGLRFALYPVFAAPAIYLLVRGLRKQNRNDLLLAGLVAGAGLYGYSPARVVPLVLVLGVLVYIAHPVSRGHRGQMMLWLGLAAVMALVVFVPLARAGLTYPEQFMSRTLTRMTSAEQPLPGPVLAILAGNLWNGLKMFNWDSGQIWVVALTGKPALDGITGALLIVGSLFLAARYILRRHWIDLFTFLSIPVLMAPSILALAFPGENPAPNRAGGALVPVFALAGFALWTAFDAMRRAWKGRLGRGAALGVLVFLLLLAGVRNYRMMFVEFADQYSRRSWNTSDGGAVIRGFATSVGSFTTAHVIPYPYWWDTRLVAFEAGRPGVDYALKPTDIETLAGEGQPQLFLLHIDDSESLTKLEEVFPEGRVERFRSRVEGHDFWIYFVPARSSLP